MTQEDKELLLKDLCARLHYGVKMNHIANNVNEPTTLIGIVKDMITLEGNGGYSTTNVEKFKPHLFPMSYIDDNEKLFAEYITTLTYDSNTHLAVPTIKTFDFYNKHHIDYRDFIEKGFAIDATGKNVY